MHGSHRAFLHGGTSLGLRRLLHGLCLLLCLDAVGFGRSAALLKKEKSASILWRVKPWVVAFELSVETMLCL